MVPINKERLIQQIKEDEGFSPKAYFDRDQWSIGYGCKGREGQVITPNEADILLKVRIEQSNREFNIVFGKDADTKFNDVRAEAFINILFNIGMGKQGGTKGLYGFKNTLKLITDYDPVEWLKVAANLKLSLWYNQVGKRAMRIVNEIRTGVKDVL